MKRTGFKEAKRRYHRLFWPAMGLYLIAVFGGAYALRQYESEPVWLAAIVAVASAAPLVFVLLLMLRHFEETDEYTRLRQLRAFAQGAVVTVGAIFVVGFLQLNGLVPSIDVFWFGPLFFFGYGLAHLRQTLAGKTV